MADGPGLRTSIYCAGCAHRCPGCHNPESWDFLGGETRTVESLYEEVLQDEFSDVTFSGGDPFYQAEAFTSLARMIRENTRKTIWCWTGFLYEEILKDPVKKALLDELDVLVDGPFILSRRNTNLLFRGSDNQRIIYLRGSEPGDIPGCVHAPKELGV